MKTAISIEDRLFREGENLAQLLKISRSELYSTALREFIKQRRDDAITEAYITIRPVLILKPTTSCGR